MKHVWIIPLVLLAACSRVQTCDKAPVPPLARGSAETISGHGREVPSWFKEQPLVPIPATKPDGFASDCDVGFAGGETYFLPFAKPQIGDDFLLSAVHIGAWSELKAFERKSHGHAPISLVLTPRAYPRPVIFPTDTLEGSDLTTVSASAYRMREPDGEGCVLSFVGNLPGVGEVRFEARKVSAPLAVLQGARRLGDFKEGGVDVVGLQGVLQVNNRKQQVDLGMMDWQPCEGGGRLSLDLSCGGAIKR